jgi:hypothetical protein
MKSSSMIGVGAWNVQKGVERRQTKCRQKPREIAEERGAGEDAADLSAMMAASTNMRSGRCGVFIFSDAHID